MVVRLVSGLVFAALIASALPGRAQPTADTPAQPSAKQRRAAAEAYDRGSAAYLAEDWAGAARWFETAHRLAPSVPALVQAIRAHRRAGQALRAATLALRLHREHASDRRAAETAAAILPQARKKFVQLDVVCTGCTVELDGQVLEFPSVFVPPHQDHRVAVEFSTGSRNATVRGSPGERREVRFDAPPAPSQAGVIAATPPAIAEPSSGLSPVWFWSAAALTGALVGLTVWSGLDALAGVDAYEQEAESGDPNRARELFDDGEQRELRTNLLLAAAATSALGATLLAFATNWQGEREEPSARVEVSSSSATLSVRGRW